MEHIINAAPHPDYPECTHEIEVMDINISLASEEVALVTTSTIRDAEGNVKARTVPKMVILRATMDTFVSAATGDLVEGPADGETIFPEFMAIYSQAFPMLEPFVNKGVNNGIEAGRYW